MREITKLTISILYDFFIICGVCAGVECDRHSLSINIEGDNLCGYICQVVDYAVEQSLAWLSLL